MKSWLLAALVLAGPAETPARFVPTTSVERFLPGLASTAHSEIRLTLSPDGRTALWFSRDRPGGAGGYDIWMAWRATNGWSPAVPVPFNTSAREFDPAFSADGRTVFFCSDRPGGSGGSDLYRVAFRNGRFGAVETLGGAVNSPGDEFAPMLAGDGRRLLFSSDRPGGAGGHDLYIAVAGPSGFAPAEALPGGINTAVEEFDPAFLADARTIVFARAADFATARVDLFASARNDGAYGPGERLPEPVNDPEQDTYGAMIDWSAPDRLLFSARRDAGQGMDLFSVGYRLE